MNNAGTDMCEAWCPGFLFPAVLASILMERARAGCNTGGKQMSTPRLLILRKTLNFSVTCTMRWLDWTTGFLCPKEPLEMPQDLPIGTQVSHGPDYFILLYMKFRVTFVWVKDPIAQNKYENHLKVIEFKCFSLSVAPVQFHFTWPFVSFNCLLWDLTTQSDGSLDKTKSAWKQKKYSISVTG